MNSPMICKKFKNGLILDAFIIKFRPVYFAAFVTVNLLYILYVFLIVSSCISLRCKILRRKEWRFSIIQVAKKLAENLQPITVVDEVLKEKNKEKKNLNDI